MVNSREALLKTLLYAEIFDFPLNKKEIYQYLISEKKVSQSRVYSDLKLLKNKINSRNGYFFINNKERLVIKRIRREAESEKKIIFALKIIKKLTFIPTLKFVGISGALSMKNSEENDDIDLFVITEEKTVWITRLMLIFILKILRVYRGREDRNIKNKICLNMITDDKNFVFLEKDINLYTAHEIAQLIPVFDKKNTYNKFIKLNKWVNSFLPNFKFDKTPYLKNKNNFLDDLIVDILKDSSIEKFAKFLQLKYMEKFITNERIKDGLLAFHPFNYRDFVLKKYRQKLKKHNLI